MIWLKFAMFMDESPKHITGGKSDIEGVDNEAKIYCVKCGNQISISDPFCTECGTNNKVD